MIKILAASIISKLNKLSLKENQKQNNYIFLRFDVLLQDLSN